MANAELFAGGAGMEQMVMLPVTRFMVTPRNLSRSIAALLVSGTLLTRFTAPSALATTYYWDVNGTTGGFSTVVGSWNTGNLWNTNATGGAGTLIANPTSADDLIIPQATTNTGIITVTGTKSGSSITFAANVGPTTTITGGAIIIGGTGIFSGIFQQSSGANTIATALTLNSTVSSFDFSNSGAGTLTIGVVTGAAVAGTQTINVGSTSTGGITLNGIIGNGVGGGNVALDINNTSIGATTLSGASTFTGGVTLTAGTLNINAVGVAGTNGPLGNGGTFTINGGTIDNTSGSAKVYANANPIVVGGNFAFSSAGGAANNNLNLPGTVDLGGATRTITSNSTGVLTLSGSISNGAITKEGTGGITLSNANTYSGVTTVNAGTLTISNATALGTTAGNTVVASGARVFAGTTTLNTAEPFTIAGAGIGGTNGAINIGGGATGVIFSGAITLSAAATIQGDGGTVTTFSGGIDLGSNTLTFGAGGGGTMTVNTTGISGTGSVIKNSLTGTVNFTTANTYTGTTTINGGILSLGNVAALGGTTGITIAGGGTLSATADGITIGAPITLGATGTNSTISFSRNAVGQGALTLDGKISGSGNLIVSTPNVNSGGQIQTIHLGSANDYLGTTTISTGNINNTVTVRAGIANALPTTTVLNVDGGNGAGTGRTITYDLNGFDQSLAGLTNNTARTLRNQRVTNSGALATLTINNSSDFSYGSTASITGAIALTKQGTGTFTLTGAANSHTGPTKVLGGILSLGHAGSLETSALDTLNSVAGDAVNGLRTTVTALTLGGLTGNKNLADVFTTTSGGYDGVTALTLNPVTGATPNYSGVIADGAAGMTLTKTGLGTQTLSGANTFTGATTVTGGTLEIAAEDALGGTSGIAVSTGGTLLLTNTGTTDRINDAATVTLAGGAIVFGGNVTEGTAPGTGALTLSANSIIDFGGGNAVINFGASGTGNPNSWTLGTTLSIYNWGGSMAGGGLDRLIFGSASNASSLTSTQLAQISFYDGGIGSNFLGAGTFVGSFGEVVPVPEPSSVFAGLALLGIAGRRERRRQQRARRITRLANGDVLNP